MLRRLNPNFLILVAILLIIGGFTFNVFYEKEPALQVSSSDEYALNHESPEETKTNIPKNSISLFDCNIHSETLVNGLYTIENGETDAFAWSQKYCSTTLKKDDEHSVFILKGHLPFLKLSPNKTPIKYEITIDGKSYYSKEFGQDEALDVSIAIGELEAGTHLIEMSANADFEPVNDQRSLSFIVQQFGFK